MSKNIHLLRPNESYVCVVIWVLNVGVYEPGWWNTVVMAFSRSEERRVGKECLE